jgi:hypothetical protein
VVRVRPAHVLPLARQRAKIRARLVERAEQTALDDFVRAFRCEVASPDDLRAGVRLASRLRQPLNPAHS